MVYTKPEGPRLQRGEAIVLDALADVNGDPSASTDAHFNTGAYASFRLLFDKGTPADDTFLLWIWDGVTAQWYLHDTAITDNATATESTTDVLNVGRGVSCYIECSVHASASVTIGIVGLDLGTEQI